MTLTPPLAVDEPKRSAELRTMKGRASGLLVLATVAFVVIRIAGDDGWLGYAAATAEAAMVGGLADWFAVTALFKHPLRLPIPHTAIIPTRKDDIGRSLGDFVQSNFLDRDLIAERVHQANVGARFGAWLAEPTNAVRVGSEVLAIARGITEVLDDDQVHTAVEQVLTDRMRSTPVAPLIARMLDAAVETNQHQEALDLILSGVDRVIAANSELLRARLAEESPWWIPETIDNRIFARVVNGVHRLIVQIAADPDHPLRAHVDEQVRALIVRLQTDTELQRRVDVIRDDLLTRPQVREWTTALWQQFEAELQDAIDRSDAPLRVRLERGVTNAGRRLRDDPLTQETLEQWVVAASRHAAGQLQGEAADLIATTVQRWDAIETGRLIELQIGRDLQFIRINGTVVGGMAGLVIHAVGQLLA